MEYDGFLVEFILAAVACKGLYSFPPFLLTYRLVQFYMHYYGSLILLEDQNFCMYDFPWSPLNVLKLRRLSGYIFFR